MRLLNYLLVAGLSALKVIPGTVLGAGFNFHPLETFIVVFVGGMLGVAFYTFFGTRIRNWNKKRRKGNPKFVIKTQKNFRRARRIMRLWHRFGIWGIAALTPPVLSPPIGTFIAVAFRESTHRILVFMGISMAIWAALFAFAGEGIKNLFNA